MKLPFMVVMLAQAALVAATAQTSQLATQQPADVVVEVSPAMETPHRDYVNWFTANPGFGTGRMSLPDVDPASIRISPIQLDIGIGIRVPFGQTSGRMNWPPVEAYIDQKFYRVTSAQLISLIKHNPPVAYVPLGRHSISTVKPVMKSGDDGVAVRHLNDFEKTAIQQLKDGADVVHEGNEKMVGAIRAQSSCTACHDVDEGALLGAFSYVLEKEKPEK